MRSVPILLVSLLLLGLVGKETQAKPSQNYPFWGTVVTYQQQYYLQNIFGELVLPLDFTDYSTNDLWGELTATYNCFVGPLVRDRRGAFYLRVKQIFPCTQRIGFLSKDQNTNFLFQDFLGESYNLDLSAAQIAEWQRIKTSYVQIIFYQTNRKKILFLSKIPTQFKEYQVGRLRQNSADNTFLLLSEYSNWELQFVDPNHIPFTKDSIDLTIRVLGYAINLFWLDQPKWVLIIESWEFAQTFIGKLHYNLGNYYLELNSKKQIALIAMGVLIGDLEDFDLVRNYLQPLHAFIGKRVKITGTWDYYYLNLLSLPDETKIPEENISFHVYDLVETTK